MRLNNKGFTLIELLAVVVILLAISVIAVSSISSAIERNKAKQDDVKIELILSKAELYYDEHKNSLKDRTCISVDSLGLSDEELEKSSGGTFGGAVIINNDGTFTYDPDKNDCPK